MPPWHAGGIIHFSGDSEFIVVWAWWSSGGKLHFFWYIYYLTVSKDEYCALSALWRRYIEQYCRGALLHLLLVKACKIWSPFFGQSALGFITSVSCSSDKILMLCPLWHSMIVCRGFAFHITPAGDVTAVRISDTSRPCHCPAVHAQF